MEGRTDPMQETARQLVAKGKGILAADESTGTITKRFESIGVGSTEENRRRYRQALFSTPGLGEHISGAILYDETIRQSVDDMTPFPIVLEKAGVIPGIKVDTGAKALALFPDETVTEGLDSLRERLTGYRDLGARFAKWRATVSIGSGRPTDQAISANAHAMARYAALCQEAGLVPIVEPEVLMDGDHDIQACAAATARTLDAVFEELDKQRVQLPDALLKVNMVISGKACPVQAGYAEVADATLACLRDHVPGQVPGVVFLSGGQSEVDATAHLNEMNKRPPKPCELSFSYGRALQDAALKAWAGRDQGIEAAQEALAHRARMNGLARSGEWSPAMEAHV